MSFRRRAGCGLLLLAPAAAMAAALGGYADLGFDSNPALAPAPVPRQQSGFAAAGLHLSQPLPAPAQAQLLMRASLDGQHYGRQAGLSNAKAALALRGRWRPAQDFYMPTLGLSLSAAHWEFDSTQRDSGEYRAGLHWQQPLAAQLLARAGYGLAKRDARSAVFDLAQRTAALDLDWRPSFRLTLSAGYQWQRGDSVSTAARAFGLLPAADRSAPDEAFGGAATDQYAYRLRSRTGVASFGANLGFSQKLALDLQLQHARSHSDRGPLRYERALARAGLLWRFGEGG